MRAFARGGSRGNSSDVARGARAAGGKRRRPLRWAVAALALAAACLGALLFWNLSGSVRSVLIAAAGPQLAPEQRGALFFYGGDFQGLGAHSLDTHAVPWRLTAASLVLHARDADPRLPISDTTLRRTLARFGFLFPDAIGNWPQGIAPAPSTLPLGMTYGRQPLLPGIGFTISNLGCAACHAGATYDAAGTARPDRAWLGLPNTSLDLEAYTDAVYRAFAATAGRPDALLAAADALFPEMDVGERLALRHLILPQVRRRIAALAEAGRATPFPNGSPGNTNGVAALKQAIGVPLAQGGAGEVGFTSIPDLGHRSWRTALLYDGSYAVPDRPRRADTSAAAATPAHLASLAAITTFFTVPSMGVAPDAALRSVRDMEPVMAFLHAYRPPVFPGRVDRAAAERGRILYARGCAQCHGSYDADPLRPRLLSFPNWIGSVGTDPARARAFTPQLADAVNGSAYRDRIAARATGHYAAPPLTGLWATAPYLHNGSVPTVAALLDPAARPARFMVGGHRLDYRRLGIAHAADGSYPADYRPWSQPVRIDVRRPGLGNGGHPFGQDLSAADRADLIEYLKGL